MTEFYEGQVVMDKKRTDPTDDLLVVVNPDLGRLDELDDGETRRLVKHNDTNVSMCASVSVPDRTHCVAVSYIEHGDGEEPTLGDDVYTFPEFRLETITSHNSSAIDGYQPYQWALAAFLGELVAALDNQSFSIDDPEDLQVLCMEASIDGKIITKGTRRGLGREYPPTSES